MDICCLYISFPRSCLILSWSQVVSWVLVFILLIKGSLLTKEMSSVSHPGPPVCHLISLLSARGIGLQLPGAGEEQALRPPACHLGLPAPYSRTWRTPRASLSLAGIFL